MTDTQQLPRELVDLSNQWLDSIEDALTTIDSVAGELDPAAASNLSARVAGVRAHTLWFRKVLTGEAPIEQRGNSDWIEPLSIDRPSAERIHVKVIQATTISAAVIEAAHLWLTNADLRRAFLLHVGDTAGTAFLNLATRLWEDFPDLAPPEWDQGKGPVSP